MREITVVLALLGLASCTPSVPDSGASLGVGFGNYAEYQRQREQQLITNAQTIAPPPNVSAEPLSALSAPLEQGAAAPARTAAAEAEQIAAETRQALAGGATGTGTGTPPPLQASPTNPAPEAVNSLGISRENDFTAVGAQRSIAEDRTFIEQNRAAYQQIQPEALPAREATGPNIVQYALQTTHPVGTVMHKRVALPGADARYVRNCGQYPSPDLAQTDFLSKGGPARDRMGLDPDGDGYACSWDPAPFRKAAGG